MKTNPNTRIAELEGLIQKYQQSYYNGEAEIADSEFDLLWDELKRIAPDSPVIKKIGADNVDGFPKAKHLIPMGSQDKAANPEEFRAWALKMGLPTLLVQYKLDGASLELQYEKGALVRAITRGDGIVGDEITANARRMAGVPHKLDTAFSGGVRGEVVMTHEVWQNKYASKANCRNAANGIMRRKDGIGCEDLRLIAYDAAANSDDSYFQDEVQKIKWLTQRGFETTPGKTFSNAEDIIAYRAEIAAMREQLPFDIDGLVVKDIVTDMADLRRPRPEKQIAFKFELETAFSILRAVEWSESGATYTPIGIVEPVRLAGTTVQRANLNNPGMIRDMGLKIGSAVCVVKRGEIIPKIEGLAPEGALPENLTTEFHGENKNTIKTPCSSVVYSSLKEIEFPSRCAQCGSDLVDAGTRLYCPNAACPKRLLHRLEKWISVLDIRELGEKLIRQLFDKERVRHIHELYTLTTEELAGYERMGELSAAKVIRHIQTQRELSLAAFVAGFDLEGVAETTMEKVAAAGFNTLEKLRAASTQALAEVYGLGEITAAVIADGLKETAGKMDAVLGAGIISIALPPPEESLPLRGLSFCFTGELSSMKRGQAEEKIKALGASAKSSVVKGLSYLVTNDPESGSAKNKKARDLGIPIIDEKGFLALLAAPEKSGKAQSTTETGETSAMPGELF
ncbi:MAG: DNA ligase (NAD(+)) LigA [Treponema sp.]|jgi:DNA ligase (NAD+)|nr:DNA ligase (NAD(+)) LigA [Treponema sp.]